MEGCIQTLQLTGVQWHPDVTRSWQQTLRVKNLCVPNVTLNDINATIMTTNFSRTPSKRPMDVKHYTNVPWYPFWSKYIECPHCGLWSNIFHLCVTSISIQSTTMEQYIKPIICPTMQVILWSVYYKVCCVSLLQEKYARLYLHILGFDIECSANLNFQQLWSKSQFPKS